MTDDGASLRLGAQWRAIANALGLRITVPVSILLPSGKQIHAAALLPDFGGPRGMLLVANDEFVWRHRTAIIEAGYGFSVLSDPGPTEAPPPVDDAMDVLRDWGWSGTADNEPAWIRQ